MTDEILDVDLLAFERLQLALADVRPLVRVVKLSAIELTQPLLTVHRARDGHLNLDLSAPSARDEKNTSKKIAENDRSTLGSAEKDSKNSPKEDWKLDVAAVAVRGGRVDWIDDTTATGKERLNTSML